MNIKEKHRCMMRMEINAAKDEDIAERLQLTKQSLWLIRKSPMYQSELAKLREAADKDAIAAAGGQKAARVLLEGEALKSATKLVDLRDNAFKEDVQLKAATEILDRVGVGKARENAPIVNITISTGKLDAINQSKLILDGTVGVAPAELPG